MEQQLFAALHLPPGSKVLDAGCGNGHVARYMARQGLRVTGIDVVERHARMARQTAAESSSLEPGSLEVHHMDYHHLEPFESASFDGAYTMETVVHAVDPEAVLAGFFRLLRPGGRVAMHEYDNVLQQDASASPPPGKINDRLRRSMAQVNEWSAMPTNAISSPGAFKHMLERAGFVDVEVRDLSENIVPMTRFFFALAIVPFLIISLLGLERYFINTVAGVQSYRGRGCWRYIQISARKPETPSGSSAAR
ncbi:S-adenosyl-L-methionine-dependent methyltransferase [Biscogniauxia mediterranea]|nr:S-adenosyl-L-methionine-dependent methyltransferase [Biscogniauxia mediterranea]